MTSADSTLSNRQGQKFIPLAMMKQLPSLNLEEDRQHSHPALLKP